MRAENVAEGIAREYSLPETSEILSFSGGKSDDSKKKKNRVYMTEYASRAGRSSLH